MNVINSTEGAAAITFGHEMFLHLEKLTETKDGKKTSAHEDYKGWSENSTKNSKIFNKYIQYLIGWYLNNEIKKAEKEKRDENEKNVANGN